LASASLPTGARASTDDFIVHGIPAKPGSWPWQVRVLSSETDKKGICGGSLIAPQWVLTAAHCLSGAKEIAIGYGSVDLDQLKVAKVEAFFIHPTYGAPPLPIDGAASSAGQDAAAKSAVPLVKAASGSALPPGPSTDVGLIKLAGPLDGVATVAIADAAADRQLDAAGAAVIVTGWGATYDYNHEKSLLDLYQHLDATALGTIMSSEKVKIPNELRQAEIQIADHQICRDAYAALKGYNDVVDDTEICAGVAGTDRDSCYGDSGGPLMAFDAAANRYVQLGIVAWGYQCGHPVYPGVYARVASFTDWIADTMARN
jgi:secreted trypsin-like serine protease